MNLNRESLRRRQVNSIHIPPSNGLPVFGMSNTGYWVHAASGGYLLHNIRIDRVNLEAFLFCFYKHTYPGIEAALCLGDLHEY